MTAGRIAVWFLLVAFPVALIAAVTRLEDNLRDVQLGVMMYALIPEVICLLGLLLWATPVVSTEVEGQTWIYLALRASGRRSVLIGKYLTAVIWTVSAAWMATLLSVAVSSAGWQMLWVMVVITGLSCVVHAALYMLIGVIFYRRTMVAAVVYTLAVEVGVSAVPALMNKFTINYRLRGLLAHWMEWEDVRSRAEHLFGSEPPETHLLVLFAVTLTFLGVSLFVVERSEYPTQQIG
jgi:ABC-type transport system involved in multi-copper enzyme maturation permease subunit